MFSVQTNTDAMKNLVGQAQITGSLKTTMERLSSGLRINRGADDPSGLAITQGMKAHFRGIDVALENAQEAMIWLESRDRLMEEQLQMAMRLKELSVRAANEATLTASDMSKMNDEAQALIAEIDKMGIYSSMNGSVDDSGTGGTQYLFGPGELDVVWVMDGTGSMTNYTATITTAATQMFNQFSARGFDLQMAAVSYTGSLPNYPPAINPATITLGFGGANNSLRAATLGNGFVTDDIAFAGQVGGLIDIFAGSEQGMDGVVEAVELFAPQFRPDAQRVMILITDADSDDQGRGDGAGENYNVDASLEAQVTAALNSNNVSLIYAGNLNELGVGQIGNQEQDFVAIANGGSVYLDDYLLGAPTTTWVNDVVRMVGAYGGDYEWSFQIGPDNVADDRVTLEFRTITASTTKLSGVTLTSAAAAQNSITAVDNGIEYIAEERATTGAYMHRLESIIDDLTAERINTTAAQSKIADTDFASTASAMTKQQIIFNTAAAAGVQANASPVAVLNLISEQNIGTGGGLLNL